MSQNSNVKPLRPRVDCPQCGKSVEWSQENRWRPFCSERCKLIDFNGWATEEHRIPSDETEGI